MNSAVPSGADTSGLPFADSSSEGSEHETEVKAKRSPVKKKRRKTDVTRLGRRHMSTKRRNSTLESPEVGMTNWGESPLPPVPFSPRRNAILCPAMNSFLRQSGTGGIQMPSTEEEFVMFYGPVKNVLTTGDAFDMEALIPSQGQLDSVPRARSSAVAMSAVGNPGSSVTNRVQEGGGSSEGVSTGAGGAELLLLPRDAFARYFDLFHRLPRIPPIVPQAGSPSHCA